MFETIKYINHVNETIEFGKDGIWMCENESIDFSWKIVNKNNRISGFQKGIVSKSIPVVIKARTEDKLNKLKNKLFEVFEKDVLAIKHGKLIIGDYYLRCFVTESKKSDYLRQSNSINVTLTISTDFPYWVKETTKTFNYGSGNPGSNLDFNNDFPYDYASNLRNVSLNNTGFYESNFSICIYGACNNPSVVIAGHEYKVNTAIEANEYLVIDSAEKTITLTKKDGTKVNCFNYRNRDSYIFQKIPSGMNTVSGSNFKFDITLFDERSEPKWT